MEGPEFVSRCSVVGPVSVSWQQVPSNQKMRVLVEHNSCLGQSLCIEHGRGCDSLQEENFKLKALEHKLWWPETRTPIWSQGEVSAYK